MRGSKHFYGNLQKWFKEPERRLCITPSHSSVIAILPYFPGNPPWDETMSHRMCQKHLTAATIDGTPPTWEEFQQAPRKPQDKSTGEDLVPPPVLHILPNELQWDLYVCLVEIWQGTPIPVDWLIVRTTMLYTKAPVKDATNYRPISVATACYGVLTKLILNRLKPAICPTVPYTILP